MEIEEQILCLFADGNERAMDVLYANYAGWLAGICMRYVPQQEDLHDVMQEALIKIATTIHTFSYRGRGSLKAWMARISINEALMFLRERKRLSFMEAVDDVPDMAGDANPPDASQLSADRVAEAIAMLPDGYRTVFNLFAIEGKSHKEIAKILNIKPDTSASQYHRAKAMMARLLRKKLLVDD